MVALYVTSTERAAGKTAIAAALAKNLQEKGKKVGYFKPLSAADSDRDASAMKQVLGLKETDEVLSPVISDPKNLSSAYEKVAQGKDIVIVEGVKGKPDGITSVLVARVILVVGYSAKFPVAGVVASAGEFGKNLLGIVVNKVPRNRIESVQKEMSNQLASAGMKLLGIVPEDRTLAALTVGELAERVGGQVIDKQKSAELVENFMVGALGLDSAVTYFNRKTNKAVITRVDRPDMQMAALETPTRCLISTGDKPPSPVVLSRAKQKKVPVIVVKDDIKATLSRIESAPDTVPFTQGKKLSRMTEILQSRFDFASLYQGLGFAIK